MKMFLTSIAIFAVCVSVCLGTEVDAQSALILKSPAFSKDEMTQVLFSASFPGNHSGTVLEYALYNPSRERFIDGIVVNIQNKTGTSGEERNVDFFIKVDCGPLQCISDQSACDIFKNIVKGSPVVTLKEVHYFIPAEMKTAAVSKVDQAPQTFVQILPDGSVAIDHVSIQLADVPAKLKQLAGLPGKPHVILSAGKDVPYAHIVKVLDACNAAGLDNVAFATPTASATDK